MGKRSELAKMLKGQREELGLTLAVLSDRSGVCVSHIARVEKGERFPSALVLRRLAKPLGIAEGQLLATAGYLTNPAGAYNTGDIQPRTPQDVLDELRAVQPIAIPIYDEGVFATEKKEAIEFAYWSPRRAADRNVRGLRINSDNLVPQIEDGNILYFDIDLKPEDGNIVIVEIGRRLHAKRYRKLKDKALLEDNQGFLDENEVSIRGVVLAIEKWIRCVKPFCGRVEAKVAADEAD